jgi:hypothetical protein
MTRGRGQDKRDRGLEILNPVRAGEREEGRELSAVGWRAEQAESFAGRDGGWDLQEDLKVSMRR